MLGAGAESMNSLSSSIRVVPPLLGTVPTLVPRHVDGGDEVAALDAILASVSQHRLMQRRPFGVAFAALAVFGGGERDCPPLARQDQVTLWMRAEQILRLVAGDDLPRDEFPVANQGPWILRARGSDDRKCRARAKLFA